MLKVDDSGRHALYSVQATRRIEQVLAASLPAHTLMQRAGLALARLALALAPHGQRCWIACGPGNNGGDGLEAAMHLQHWGKQVFVSWLGQADTAPPDAARSYRRASAAGVAFINGVPDQYDLCIDALLGIGARSEAPQGRIAELIRCVNAGRCPVLAVDLPSGLNADTGAVAGACINASHTLSLLTLKPGLFTAHGRDAAASVWLDDLGAESLEPSGEPASAPSAWLGGASVRATRRHASHKGSYGDVAVLGGAPGMSGAPLLAASAALHGGAGRVFVALLDEHPLTVDVTQPELMFRPPDALDYRIMTVVCGCGGGNEIRQHLAQVLSTSARLVVDADAINAIADDTQLQTLLSARARRTPATVLTPHPLEAARLIGCTTAQVQADRLLACRQLAQRYGCTVVLKGSGTVLACPGQIPVVNPTGNARLATAGSGDVLAGMLGAALAAGLPAFAAASHAVYQHGLAADRWNDAAPLTASALARAIAL